MDEQIHIIEKSPFVKEDDPEGFLWLFRVVDPITNRLVETSFSPYALLNSLGEAYGEQELLTCSCGVAGCAGIYHEKFKSTERFVHWSFVNKGIVY